MDTIMDQTTLSLLQPGLTHPSWPVPAQGASWPHDVVLESRAPLPAPAIGPRIHTALCWDHGQVGQRFLDAGQDLSFHSGSASGHLSAPSHLVLSVPSAGEGEEA